MTSELTTIDSNATLREVACEMKNDDIGNVVIMDGEKLCGIITDRDIVVRAVAAGKDLNSRVADFITKEVVTVPCVAGIDEAANVMATHKLRRLLVVDSAGDIIGIVSLADLIRTSGGADKKVLTGIFT